MENILRFYITKYKIRPYLTTAKVGLIALNIHNLSTST